MGCNYDWHGFCDEFSSSDRSSISSRKSIKHLTIDILGHTINQGDGYSWLFSGHHHLFFLMVSKTRTNYENYYILYCHIRLWSIRWHSGNYVNRKLKSTVDNISF